MSVHQKLSPERERGERIFGTGVGAGRLYYYYSASMDLSYGPSKVCGVLKTRPSHRSEKIRLSKLVCSLCCLAKFFLSDWMCIWASSLVLTTTATRKHWRRIEYRTLLVCARNSVGFVLYFF